MDRLAILLFSDRMTSRVLTIAAVVGSAVSGGVLFAFSSFVMRALADLPDEEGIAAMQSVNRKAPTPLFMVVFLGTAAVCVALFVVAVRHAGLHASRYQMIGSALYLAGILLTVVYHVPHNNALALVDPNGPGASQVWKTYVTTWTAWNHVRTFTSVAGSVVFTFALTAGPI
jgi:uncharacterized membrane protein